MFVKTEINDFETIAKNAWSGAIQVCNEVIKQGKENEAMCLIEEIFAETMPTAGNLNDFIWFELGDLMHLWDDEDDEDDAEDDDEDDAEEE